MAIRHSREHSSLVRVGRNAWQTLIGAVQATIQYDTVIHDLLGEWNLATFRFTASSSGYYFIHAHCRWRNIAAGSDLQLLIYRFSALGGFLIARDSQRSNGGTTMITDVSIIRYLNRGEGFYVDAQDSTVGNDDIYGDIAENYCEIVKIK